jgi:hypothetical protein
MARLVLPLSFLFLLLFTADLTAQTGSWVNHPMTGRLPYIYDMDMANENFGILICQPDVPNDFGGVVFTTDGWNHWSPTAATDPIFTPSPIGPGGELSTV